MKKYLPYAAGLIAALFISIGIGYGVVSMQSDDKNFPQPPPPQTSDTAQPAAVKTEPEKVIKHVEKQSGPLNALDLSLGDITIGDTKEKVYQVLSQPNTTRTEDGRLRMMYGNIEVVMEPGGKVSAWVSQSAEFSTPRGIREGSAEQEVLNAYGYDCMESDYENDHFYEYTIKSVDGIPCLLRFAVRNSDRKVNYMSARFVQ